MKDLAIEKVNEFEWCFFVSSVWRVKMMNAIKVLDGVEKVTYFDDETEGFKVCFSKRTTAEERCKRIEQIPIILRDFLGKESLDLVDLSNDQGEIQLLNEESATPELQNIRDTESSIEWKKGCGDKNDT